jgi:hypothetical protein
MTAAVRPGTLSCARPEQLTCSSRYLFVTSSVTLLAFDMMRDDLPCVWKHKMGGRDVYGAAMALHDSVLNVALHSSLLPVDIRAKRPADWKVGAVYDDESDGGSTVDPLDVAYADGRLFVTDSNARTVRIFDVAMDPTAVAAPIAKDGAPLLTLQPISLVSSTTIPELTYPSSMTATPATALRGARVFVSNDGRSTIVEMTRDGVCVRTLDMDGLCNANVLGIGIAGDGDGDWLFAVRGGTSPVCAVALTDRPERSWKAAQDLGTVCEEHSAAAYGAVAIGGMFLIAHKYEDCIDIVPLPASFI